MIKRALEHLATLVACDTRNPPRTITSESAVFRHCASALRASGCDLQLQDLGDGSVTLLAIRGAPTTLINCHLDTVPDTSGWLADPFSLRVDGDRAIGLGACDTKGGAACLLAAMEESDADIAILLTSDEEAGPSRCVRAYLADPLQSVDRVIVTEPTLCRAVVEHRGLATGEIEFKGTAGHVSTGRQSADSALHRAVTWSAEALHAFDGGDDHRFNIGVLQGGTKPNMIASNAVLQFGVRPPANVAITESLARLQSLISDTSRADWRVRFQAPSLQSHNEAVAFAARCDLTPGESVDFWTEAALFGAAGVPTLVFGPGDIAQAHAPEEFVLLTQLETACDAYVRILNTRED